MSKIKGSLLVEYKFTKQFLLITLGMIVLYFLLSLEGGGHIGSTMAIGVPMSLVYLPAIAMQGMTTGPIVLRLGSTRKQFFISKIIYLSLTALLISAIEILGFYLEHLFYRANGNIQSVILFKVVNIGEVSGANMLGLFGFLFGIGIAILGLLVFSSFLLSLLFRGVGYLLGVVFIIGILYYEILFGSLNSVILTIIMQQYGMVLNIKLIILGYSGIVLTWPFIDRSDINKFDLKLRWGR